MRFKRQLVIAILLFVLMKQFLPNNYTFAVNVSYATY